MAKPDKQVYIQRIARALDAHGELDFLERLSHDELALLWTRVTRQALQHGRFPASRVARTR